MLSSSENCARTPPAARDVDPEASSSRSSSSTSRTPASARWKAMLAPMTPPPTTTTSAVSGQRGGHAQAALTAGITSRPYASSVSSCEPVIR